MNDEQYDIWLATEVENQRQYRIKFGMDEVPNEILAEEVMQELLRDSIYGCEPLLTFCARRVAARSMEFELDYQRLQSGEDASDKFHDQLAMEIAARVNEILKDLNRRKPTDDDSL